jgi:membrane-associated phospholipid phosphatase
MPKSSNVKKIRKQAEEKLVGKQTTIARRRDFRGLILIILVSFIGLGTLVKLHPSNDIDLSITHFIQQINAPWFDLIMRTFTLLGNAVPAIITVIILVAVLFILKRKKESLLLLISSAGASLISAIAKTIVARPRPDPNVIHQIGIYSKSDSFPSGHVLVLMGIYGCLFYLVFTRLKKGLLRIVLIDIFLIILFLIGISRIYLGAHWFSDVLGSYFIGTAWIFCIYFLDNKIKLGEKK